MLTNYSKKITKLDLPFHCSQILSADLHEDFVALLPGQEFGGVLNFAEFVGRHGSESDELEAVSKNSGEVVGVGFQFIPLAFFGRPSSI